MGWGATFGPNDGYCDPHGIAMGYLRLAANGLENVWLDGRAHSINIDELRIDRLANKEIHTEFNVY